MQFLVYSPTKMTWPLSEEKKAKLAALEQKYNAKIISCRPEMPGAHYSAEVGVIFNNQLMKDAHRTRDFVGMLCVSNFKLAVRNVLCNKTVLNERDHEG